MKVFNAISLIIPFILTDRAYSYCCMWALPNNHADVRLWIALLWPEICRSSLGARGCELLRHTLLAHCKLLVIALPLPYYYWCPVRWWRPHLLGLKLHFIQVLCFYFWNRFQWAITMLLLWPTLGYLPRGDAIVSASWDMVIQSSSIPRRLFSSSQRWVNWWVIPLFIVNRAKFAMLPLESHSWLLLTRRDMYVCMYVCSLFTDKIGNNTGTILQCSTIAQHTHTIW